jgi:subtilisin-like proprotein convertase family protein
MLSGVGDARNVTAGFSAAANSLAAGIYNSTVSFTNDSGGTGSTTRPVTLDVGRYTYTYPGPPISIPENNPAGVTSTLTVPDAFCVGDVDVEVNITHTYIGDLIVELRSPTGIAVRLHNRTGGSADNLVRAYDQGVVNPDGPGSLNDFNGQPAAGVWTLFVSDNANLDIGAINSWKLKIAAAGALCPPIAQDQSINVPDTVTTPITLVGLSGTGSPLTYIIQSLPANGTLRDATGNTLITTVPYPLAANGNTVNYRPDPMFIGNDPFTFTCDDGQPSNTATVSVRVGLPQMLLMWNMDTNPGWTYGPNWAWGQPQGLSGDPAAGVTGTNVVGYNLSGDYANNAPRTYATTPPIDLTGAYFTTLQFHRWLGIESATFDQAGVEISTNGTTWTPVWVHTSTTSLNESAWTLHTYDISAVADNQPTVYLRWYLGTTDGSVVYHGWNIDDVVIKGAIAPTAPPPCYGDADDDLDRDFNDITTVLGNWGANYLPTPGTGPGDADDDGDADFADITTVLSVFGVPCP